MAEGGGDSGQKKARRVGKEGEDRKSHVTGKAREAIEVGHAHHSGSVEYRFNIVPHQKGRMS